MSWTTFIPKPTDKLTMLPGAGCSLRQALVRMMRAKAGWNVDVPKAHALLAAKLPIERRAGAPIKGGFPVEEWAKKWGDIVVDIGRTSWLPDDWGQGVKWTKPTAHSTGSSGGSLTSFISPDGRRFYHKERVEEWCGCKLSSKDGFNGQMRRAWLLGLEAQCVSGGEWAFFKLLSPTERKHLPGLDELHVCIISGMRTRTPEGVKDLATVQAQFLAAGVEPTWYVDEVSVNEYRMLGLKAVVGGKLTPARNMALADAARMGKACLQVSDDVSRWEHRHGPQAKDKSDAASNAAHAAAKRYLVSPVTAARFILAKLRACGGRNKGPQLGGVYPRRSCSRAFCHESVGSKHFIIGDFFVVDNSPVRFDENMSLKEDYAFTAEHIEKHGSVLRLNRMTITAKHGTNAGGAVAQRDGKGIEEEKNIAILMRRWPKVFRRNPHREHEVILRWPGTKTHGEEFEEFPNNSAEELTDKSARAAKRKCVAEVPGLAKKKACDAICKFG